MTVIRTTRKNKTKNQNQNQSSNKTQPVHASADNSVTLAAKNLSV